MHESISNNTTMGKEGVRPGNKHEKKRSEGRSGNGVGGFAVGCGALAVAGFLAVASFATKKNKKKRVQFELNPQPQQKILSKSQQDHEIETQQHLQHSTNPTSGKDAPCYDHDTTNSKSINQPSIQEERIDPVPDHNTNTTYEVVCPTCFHRQEIMLSDDFPPESAASSNDSGTEEECFHSHGSPTLDFEPQERQKSLETETEYDDIFTPEAEAATSNEKGKFPVVVSDHQPWTLSHSVKLKSWFVPMLLLALFFPLLPVIHCTCRLSKHFLERVYGDRRTGARVP